MTMIPWENGADIALPVWLEGAAALVAFEFPIISEGALAALSRDYLTLAFALEQDRRQIDLAAVGLTDSSFGPAVTAFSLHRERLSGPNGSHMIVSSTTAGLIGAAYAGAAAEVVAMKLSAILSLIDLFLKTEAVKTLLAGQLQIGIPSTALTSLTNPSPRR